MKIKHLYIFCILTPFVCSPLAARSSDFFGGFAGGALGSVVGSAMTRQRTKTVVVPAAPAASSASSADITILNEKVKQLAYENTKLRRANLDLEEKIRRLEEIIANQKKQLNTLKRQSRKP